jgi:hypothetical protein
MSTKLEATDSQDHSLHSASREDAPEQGYALEAESTILTGTKLAVVFTALQVFSCSYFPPLSRFLEGYCLSYWLL